MTQIAMLADALLNGETVSIKNAYKRSVKHTLRLRGCDVSDTYKFKDVVSFL